jgi:hypothetical protein
MNSINVNIDNIVRKNIREVRLNEIHKKYGSIIYKTKDELIEQSVIMYIDLLVEGYTIKEIDNYFDKNIVLNEIEIPYQDSIKDAVKDFDFKKTVTTAFKSQIKEIAINWVLTSLFGTNEFTYALSKILGDLDFKTLLLPFKDLQNCEQHLPTTLDAILEYLASVLIDKVSGKKVDTAFDWFTNLFFKGKPEKESGNKIFGKLFGSERDPGSTYNRHRLEWNDVLVRLPIHNFFGEVIRQTNTSEELAKMICKRVHK